MNSICCFVSATASTAVSRLALWRRTARRGCKLGLLFGVPLIAGCAGSGEISKGFVNPRLMDAYVPLYMISNIGIAHFGAGFAVAPHVAVTNEHNANLVAEDMVLARSRDYDLLFFRTDREMPVATGDARVGESVIAYGQMGKSTLKEAKGVVRHCAECAARGTLAYDAHAGQGFSGGPVVDLASGTVVGITVGFEDGKAEGGGRRMYAYGMDVVMAEMQRLLGQ